jgi:hypothetical protein
MIARNSRDRLSQALRQYVSGVITNDDLDEIEVDERDPGVVAVKDQAWFLYDDRWQHRARGHHYLARPARDEIGCWILFLHSDLEYPWPDYHFIPAIDWPMSVLTLGWWSRRKKRQLQQYNAAGDIAVWPFATRADYEYALAHPKLFAKGG